MRSSDSSLIFEKVIFAYDDRPTPVLEDLSLSLGPGWTCVAGPNGSGKTTFALLACGILKPDSGSISRPEPTAYCAQRVDRPPTGVGELLADGGSDELRGVLGVRSDWPDRWDRLSLGERRRLQAWVALEGDPGLLVLDEPTNHLDAEAKRILAESLARFRGVGVLVSHDRDFADAICRATLLLPEWRVFDASLSTALEIRDEEARAARERRKESEREVARLSGTARSARSAEERSARSGSKSRLDPRDRDGKARIDLARMTGRDAVAGRARRRMEDRVARARAELDGSRASLGRKEGLAIPSTPSKRDALATAGPGTIALGPDRSVFLPELRLGPLDRVGLRGANGSGKSTLLRALAADAGVRGVDLAYIPQDLGEEEGARGVAEARAAGNDPLARAMSQLYLLGSDPEALLSSAAPSPGEARKLLLALAFARDASLVIADEITNHLDLTALRCLEAALADYSGALLLASHDLRFLEACCEIMWTIEGGRLRIERLR